MPVILSTEDSNGALMDIFDLAEKYIIIVCPFLKFTSKIKKSIEIADSKNVNILVVYGKGDIDEDEMDWLKTIKHIEILYQKNLHAKYYANEKLAMITSMNLYDYSQINNEELGIFIDSSEKEDYSIFYEALEMISRIIDRSNIEYATVKYHYKITETGMVRRHSKFENGFIDLDEKIEIKKKKKEKKEIKSVEKYYCIRCGKEMSNKNISFFCKECNKEWTVHKNSDSKEQFCHICGVKYTTSISYPTCKKCYPEYAGLIKEKRKEFLKLMK